MKIGRNFFGLGRTLALASLLIGPTVAQAAVTVTLSASNLTPVAGGNAFAYTVNLTNPDASAATSVVMTLPLPPGVRYANGSIGGAQSGAFSCVTPGVGDNGTVVCRAASFPASGAATIDVVVTCDPDLSGGVRTATARVVASGNQNAANRLITIQNDANVSISLAATDSAQPGGRASLLITLNNAGSSSAVNSVVTMVLPPEVQFAGFHGTSALADVCAYYPDSRQILCSAPHVQTGLHQLTVTLDVPPNQPQGTAHFTATMTSGIGTVSGSPAMISTAIAP